jgi:hypothetical protein
MLAIHLVLAQLDAAKRVDRQRVTGEQRAQLSSRQIERCDEGCFAGPCQRCGEPWQC